MVLPVPRLSENLDQIVCFQLCQRSSIARFLHSPSKSNQPGTGLERDSPVKTSRAVGDERNTTALTLVVGPSQRGADRRAKRTDGWLKAAWAAGQATQTNADRTTAWGWQAG
jgi:hypothetical protein